MNASLMSLQQLIREAETDPLRDDEAARVGQSTSDVEYQVRDIELHNLQDLIDAFNGDFATRRVAQ
jgi:hypothetical protein